MQDNGPHQNGIKSAWFPQANSSSSPSQAEQQSLWNRQK